MGTGLHIAGPRVSMRILVALKIHAGKFKKEWPQVYTKYFYRLQQQ
jgi:hypothetical protein